MLDPTHPIAGSDLDLVGLLRRAALEPEVGVRLLDRQERASFLSWGELLADGERVAAGLAALGVARGERVGLIFPTGREFFAAFFGCWLAGAVPAPLYPPVRLGRLEEYHQRTAAMLQAAAVPLVLADGRVASLLGQTVERAKLRLGLRRLAELPSGPARRSTPSPSDLALVQFSSGTTTLPKPVALSHRAVVAQVQALNRQWPALGVARPTGVSWLPLYHDMGLIGCIFTAMAWPSTLTLIPPEVFVVRPAIWLRALSTWQATISVAPNFAFGLCVDKIEDYELEGVDLGSWRVALNGAEAISPRVLRAFQERFSRWGFRPEALTPVYGLSEASLAVTASPLERSFRSAYFDRQALTQGKAQPVAAGEGVELVSLGGALPGFAVRIEGEAGNEAAPGKIGRVHVSGPSLMDGYLGQPALTAATLRDGWLDTGDLGFVYQRELYLTGRAKDVLILRGRNFSPAEVEQSLDLVEGVRKGCGVAVSYLPENNDGTKSSASEILVVFAERRSAKAPPGLDQAIVEQVLATTGLRVDQVVLLEPGTLPRTSSGKLRRGDTLRLFLAGELQPPTRVTPWRMAGAWARSALAFRRARRSRASQAPEEQPQDG